MTVQELKEKLNGMPDDACVMVKHDLVGYEHYVEAIIYNEKDYWSDFRGIRKQGVVWIREIND